MIPIPSLCNNDVKETVKTPALERLLPDFLELNAS